MLGEARIRARIPQLREAAGPDSGGIPGDGDPLRLAILGDSAAAGVGAPDHGAALAGQTSSALAALTGRALSWRVVARIGATARTLRRDLLPGITEPPTGWRPDLVLVVVGVNDAVRLRAAHRFRADVAHLVAAIRQRLGAPVPILLAGLPPIHRFPALPAPVRLLLGLHARRLDRQLARLARRDAALFHLPVRYRGGAGAFFAPDGYHPAPAAYRYWGRELAVQTATVLDTAFAGTAFAGTAFAGTAAERVG